MIDDIKALRIEGKFREMWDEMSSSQKQEFLHWLWRKGLITREQLAHAARRVADPPKATP